MREGVMWLRPGSWSGCSWVYPVRESWGPCCSVSARRRTHVRRRAPALLLAVGAIAAFVPARPGKPGGPAPGVLRGD